MKRIIIFSLAMLAILVLNSCYKDLDNVLFGTWSVTKVEGTLNENDSSVQTYRDTSSTGTIVFKNTGKGEQNYSFTFNDTVYSQTGTFTWQADQDEITINRVTQANMVWTRIVDTDNRQVASFNVVVDADRNWDYTLTLEK